MFSILKAMLVLNLSFSTSSPRFCLKLFIPSICSKHTLGSKLLNYPEGRITRNAEKERNGNVNLDLK